MNLNDLFNEEKVRLDPKCWTGKKIGNPKTKMKGGVRVNNCVPAESVAEGSLELNTPDPVVVVQDLKGNILDKINLSVAVQKYKLGQPQNIKNQLAHQNYTKVGNYTIVSPMSGQPQDATTQGVAETELDEKSVSQAQFRTMAGAAHNPEFARKVGISQDVAKEFHSADKHSNYKKLPDRATEGSLEEVDRRGFLKGMGAAALAGAAGGIATKANAQDIGLVQKQYNWQFADTKGKDTIVDIVKRSAGGRVAITARKQYFLIYDWNDIKSKVPKGFDPGPYGLVLMAVPKEILGSNMPTTTDTSKNNARQQNLDRMSGSTSASYAGRIKARIMPNVTGQSAGPVAVEIRSSPDGTIISRKLVKSSGNTEWDQSVLKGIDKTDVLPRDIDGRVPSTITVNIGESVEQGVAEGEQQPDADYRDPKEVDYDAIDHDKSVARLRHLAGLGPLKTVYDPAKRVYKNVPTADQPKR